MLPVKLLSTYVIVPPLATDKPTAVGADMLFDIHSTQQLLPIDSPPKETLPVIVHPDMIKVEPFTRNDEEDCMWKANPNDGAAADSVHV